MCQNSFWRQGPGAPREKGDVAAGEGVFGPPLTASGSLLLALVSPLYRSQRDALDGNVFVAGLALFVDGIDGPIARKLQVKEVLPNWSDTLDNIIDYVTYVLMRRIAPFISAGSWAKTCGSCERQSSWFPVWDICCADIRR